MRILYIADVRLPTERAHGLQIIKTCEAFAAKGNQVLLLVPYTFNHLMESPFTYYGVTENFSIRYVRSFDWRRWGRPGYLLHVVYFTVRVCALAPFLKKDVLYSRGLIISFLLSLVSRGVVYEDHEPPASWRFLYEFCIKKIPQKVVVPHALGELYTQMGIRQESFKIIPNGVDIGEFDGVKRNRNVWKDADMPVALYVGYFHGWKGVYTLLDSAEELLGECRVVLVGSTNETEGEVQEYLERKNITNVSIYPFAKHREVIVYIRSADVLVLPNTGAEERSLKYTTPLKLFEYMASGVPIVASEVQSFAPFLRHQENALLLRPDDPKALAWAIRTLLEDKALRERLAREAYVNVQGYSWHKRAESILEFISRSSFQRK
jgi:glycosyltransferase involved in cell wall biosynthesis